MAKQATTYGAINHAGGRRIVIESAHVEWVDWASTALYAHDDLIAALKSAQFAFGFGSSATPQQQQDAAELITATLIKYAVPGMRPADVVVPMERS